MIFNLISIVHSIRQVNPIPVGGGVLSTPPYSFIVLTHIKVKQITSNDLTFLYGNNTQDKSWMVSISQIQDPQWAFKVS